MQFNYIEAFKKFLFHKTAIKVFKWTIMAFILWYLIGSLHNERQLGWRIYHEMQALVHRGTIVLLLIPVALVFLNWSLEAVKWQMLSLRIEKLTFRESLAGVLAGQSLAFVTPQSLGDYAGRVWNLKNSGRLEAIGAVLLGKWVQSIVTGMFGSLGLLCVLSRELSWTLNGTILAGIGACLVWVGLIFLLMNKRNRFIAFLQSILGKRLIKYINVVRFYRREEIVKIMLLATGRYLVFSLQFFMIIELFNPELMPSVILAGITWMFLIKSVMPAINIFTDLGVREMAVVYFFSYYEVNMAVIILASVLLWIFNILLPTFAGLFYVYRLKITNA